MGAIKVTFFFSANQRGWTESYYQQTDNIDLQIAWTQANDIAIQRAALLGKQAKIFAWRCSNEAEKNDAFLDYKDRVGVSQDCADLDISIQARFENVNNTRYKFTFLRGFWDTIEVEGGRFTGKGSAAFTTAFSDWLAALRARSYSWKTRRATGPSSDIQTYAQNTNGTVKITLKDVISPPAALNSKNLARISGVNKGSALNGQQLVQITGASEVTTVDRIAVFPYVSGGVVKLSDTGYSLIDFATPQKVVPRKSGAPLLATRGRRPARARG